MAELGSAVDTSIWNAMRAAFPDAILTSANRPGDSGFHGRASACDIAGPNMGDYAAYAVNVLGAQLAQVIYGPGPLLYNVGGTNITDQAQLRNQVYAGDLAGHYDHVHIAAEHPLSGSFPGADATNRQAFIGSVPGLSGLANTVDSTGDFLAWLAEPRTWVRVAMAVGGSVAILVGLWQLIGAQSANAALKFINAKPVTKAVQTGVKSIEQ